MGACYTPQGDTPVPIGANFLSEECKITTVAPVATGTTTITSAAFDMTGFDGALFIIRLGTPATNNNIRVKQCDTSGGTYADLAGTKVGDHATDTPLIVDVKRPLEQFLKYEVTRGTTTTIDTTVVIQYRARNRGVTQPSGTQIERWHAPAEGTA
jgi:hypothetical protein